MAAIDLRAIWEWADRNGIRDPFVRQHFEAVIIATDNITLRRVSKSADRGGEDRPDPGKSSARQGGRRMPP